MKYHEKSQTFEYHGRVYDVEVGSGDARHGGPFDRGSADSYYGRRQVPHYYLGGTRTSKRIDDLTNIEKEAYRAGYIYNEDILQDFKDWG
tara:strand:+ start:10541 stop:10810 length:270 start_codon:yes stop_codon:yes gene_type:complete